MARTRIETAVFCETAQSAPPGFPGADTALSLHRHVDLFLITGGLGTYRILDRSDECGVGDLFVIGGGVPSGFFSVDADHPLTYAHVSFDPGVLLPAPYADPASSDYCYGMFEDRMPLTYAMLNGRMQKEGLILIGGIEEALHTKGLFFEESIRSGLTLLLITLSRYVHQAETVQKEGAIGKPEDWATVSEAIRLILSECHDSTLTLETIASRLYVSRSHLSRIFRRVTGVAFADYVRDIRMNMACRLLRATNSKNEEIVALCGIKDIPTFYRQFKARMGMTPYQYRMTIHTNKGDTEMSIYKEISEQLQKGKAKIVEEMVKTAIENGEPAAQILNEGLLAGMSVIGEKFKNNEVYVPEVLVAARAMNRGMNVLKPLLVEDGVESKGKVCIGTVRGDLHDIGKNLVRMMMEGKGLEVIDLGVDVAPETFIKTAIEEKCQVICCSALLTTTMGVMAEVVRAAQEAGIRDSVKIMIGGAPVTEEYRAEIGADRYTPDAATAADVAVELCG